MASGDQGTVVLARSDSGPVAGVVVESRAGKLGVLTVAGVRESWVASRVFFFSGVRISSGSAQHAAAAVEAFVQRISVMAESADLAGAWELLGGRADVGADELADLLFSADGSEEQAAAAWAVEKDSIHFKMIAAGRYAPASEAAVTSQLRERAQAPGKPKFLTGFIGRLPDCLIPDGRPSCRITTWPQAWAGFPVLFTTGRRAAMVEGESGCSMLRGASPPNPGWPHSRRLCGLASAIPTRLSRFVQTD